LVNLPSLGREVEMKQVAILPAAEFGPSW